VGSYALKAFHMDMSPPISINIVHIALRSFGFCCSFINTYESLMIDMSKFKFRTIVNTENIMNNTHCVEFSGAGLSPNKILYWSSKCKRKSLGYPPGLWYGTIVFNAANMKTIVMINIKKSFMSARQWPIVNTRLRSESNTLKE